jgi:hypothetical protein
MRWVRAQFQRESAPAFNHGPARYIASGSSCGAIASGYLTPTTTDRRDKTIRATTPKFGILRLPVWSSGRTLCQDDSWPLLTSSHAPVMSRYRATVASVELHRHRPRSCFSRPLILPASMTISACCSTVGATPGRTPSPAVCASTPTLSDRRSPKRISPIRMRTKTPIPYVYLTPVATGTNRRPFGALLDNHAFRMTGPPQ